MRDRARPRRAVELVQYVLSLLLGPTHVVTLRLLWLALLFYGERGVFHDAANRCQWPEQALPAGIDARPPVHILLVTDPQIIDRDTYPSLPFPTLLYPVVRHFSDNYLKNVWTSLAVNPNKWMMRENILPWQPRTQDRLRPSTTLAQPPDAVVWMGDLTDGGRRHRTEQEWAALVLRFRSIFWRPREADWEAPKATLGSTRHLIVPRTSANMYIPTFHLSGNHDIGLPGTSTSGQRIDVNAADDAIERFNRDFGMKIDGGGFVVKDRNPFLRSSLNGRILASTDVSLGATHELVLVNAQDLVGMQRQGGGPFDTYLASAHQGELDGALGTEAHRAYNETYEFVDSVKRGGFRVPRVLLTHVPLYRPEGAGCDDAARSVQHGVTREAARPLHQGTDRGSTYQNMVSESVSDWVLRSIDPAAVFSGDDHDHCEYRHRRPAGPVAEDGSVEGFALGEIPELTVKSVSMTEVFADQALRASVSSRRRSRRQLVESNSTQLWHTHRVFCRTRSAFGPSSTCRHLSSASFCWPCGRAGLTRGMHPDTCPCRIRESATTTTTTTTSCPAIPTAQGEAFRSAQGGRRGDGGRI